MLCASGSGGAVGALLCLSLGFLAAAAAGDAHQLAQHLDRPEEVEHVGRVHARDSRLQPDAAVLGVTNDAGRRGQPQRAGEPEVDQSGAIADGTRAEEGEREGERGGGVGGAVLAAGGGEEEAQVEEGGGELGEGEPREGLLEVTATRGKGVLG